MLVSRFVALEEGS